MASDGNNPAPEDPLEARLAEHEKWLARRVAQGKSGAVTLALVHGEQGEPPRVVHLYAPDPKHVPESSVYAGKTLNADEMSTVFVEHASWLNEEGRAGRRARLMNANLRCLPPTAAAEARAKEQAQKEQPRDAPHLNLKLAHLHQANLSDRNLSGAQFDGAWLDGANLSGCNLRNAVFRGASLKGADLSGADVSGASFAGADLTLTNFHRAHGLRTLELSGVDFSQARGIPAVAFAGRSTVGCKLPEGTLDGLAHVSDASRNARTVFQVMLLACLYCLLTVHSATDQQVIMNVGRTPLPILAIEISVQGFFLVAPFLLVLSLVYLHMYLRHVWTGAARLPARFPDGTSVGERISPWIMTALIDRYRAAEPTQSKARAAPRSIISRCEEWLALLLGFWTVPITVALIAARYLTRQSALSVFHAEYLWFSIMFAAVLQVSMIRTLRQPPAPPTAAGYDTPHELAVPAGRARLTAVVITVLIGALYAGVRTELGLSLFAPELPKAAPPANSQSAAAAASGAAAQPMPADEDSWGSDKLNFARRSLIGAHGNLAYLKKANLSNANLSLADLRGATLRAADLNGAKLHCADLSSADLRDVLGLTQKMLNEACGDGKIKLPTGFTSPTACPADCVTKRAWRAMMLGVLPTD